MNFRIPIPRWLVSAWDRFGDWANVAVWQRGRLELRRVDLIIAAGFVFSTGYYYFTIGWLGAVQSAALYIFIAMIALWFF